MDTYSAYPRGISVIKPEPHFVDNGPQDVHQLRHIPKHDQNTCRTVLINDLPSNTKITQVFPLLKGGIIVEATLLETSTIFKKNTRSAMVWFYDSDAAAAYVSWAKKTWLHCDGVALDVQMIKTPTWKITHNLEYDIEAKGCRRAFTVYNLPQPVDE